MKKTKEVLFILSVLCIGLMLSGCDSGGGGSSTKESTLTLDNCPAGNLGVLVYSNNTLPTTYTEYLHLSDGGTLAASYNQTSPFTLTWINSIQSGPHVVVISASENRFGLAQFDSKGNATLNWNIMTPTSVLP
jgi:hypothetical protein